MIPGSRGPEVVLGRGCEAWIRFHVGKKYWRQGRKLSIFLSSIRLTIQALEYGDKPTVGMNLSTCSAITSRPCGALAFVRMGSLRYVSLME